MKKTAATLLLAVGIAAVGVAAPASAAPLSSGSGSNVSTPFMIWPHSR